MDYELLTDREVPTPSARAFVVYQKKTGRVLHIHQAVSFGQGRQLSETLEQQAIRAAGNKATGAAVLEVDPDEVSILAKFKVNVRTGRLERRELDMHLKKARTRKATPRRRVRRR